MRRSRMLAVAALLGAVFGMSDFAAAIDEPNPTPPTTGSGQTSTGTPKPTSGTNAPKKKSHKKPKTTAQQKSGTADFVSGYHAAHALIYDHGNYAGGIAALRALGQDDNADVATLLGYASRKLGRYDDAKLWYERALAADPNHAITWSYYGMWQAEQGNLLKARENLEKVRSLCGTGCRAYTELKAVIEGTKTY